MHQISPNTKIAYFSMEIGFNPDIPTYSGGLGILAGDTMKSAADWELPLIGVSLLYHEGYCIQFLDKYGWQSEKAEKWHPANYMTLLPNIIQIELEKRIVLVQAWQYDLIGAQGHCIPLLFLDTNLPENQPEDRTITNELYGGDAILRLKQEAVLGIAGTKMLQSLNLNIDTYHINEGHAALLTVELLNQKNFKNENVKPNCVFTTHTPIAAGQDHFPYELAYAILGEKILPWHIKELAGEKDLSVTLLALNLSRFANGVSKKHKEITKNMFPRHKIDYITNGVHSKTWTCDGFKKLFNKYIPDWEVNPHLFEKVPELIPDDIIWQVHNLRKKALLSYIYQETGQTLSPDILTIGFARRATPYKRASLLFYDLKHLIEVGNQKIQIVYAGKAHPQDTAGKQEIKNVIASAKNLKDKIKIVFLENYDMHLGALITSGVDLWLNTPLRPREACGTSGMKAAHNGVPNFSTLDGWWIEGHSEDMTGWSIGPPPLEKKLVKTDDAKDAHDLYNKLEQKIIPMFYNNRSEWIKIMKNAIAMNANFFNSHRMVQEYAQKAYNLKKLGV